MLQPEESSWFGDLSSLLELLPALSVCWGDEIVAQLSASESSCFTLVEEWLVVDNADITVGSGK